MRRELLHTLARVLEILEALNLPTYVEYVELLMDTYYPVTKTAFLLPPDLQAELDTPVEYVFQPRSQPQVEDKNTVVNQQGRGAKGLLAAIVRRAIYDWVLYRESIDNRKRKRAEDAYHWLFEEPLDGITSFPYICAILDFDIHVCRNYIRKFTINQIQSVVKVSVDKKATVLDLELEIHADVPYTATDLEDLVNFF